MSFFESIVNDLRALPPPKLVEVSNYIHRLHPSVESSERRLAALRATSGCMAREDGEDFERAVRETADRIDANTPVEAHGR
jgi:hypothetical protein